MPSDLALIRTSKPDSKVAEFLREKGARILPFAEGYSEAYLPSPRVIVHRKTTHGFLASIEDRSLFVEATESAESDRAGVFVIEGVALPKTRDFHPNAVRGAITALIIEYGVSVITTASPEETAELILMMAKQEQHGIPEITLHPKRRAVDVPDVQRRVVEMLPGAGLVIARELLKEFGTIEKIASASAEELAGVKGVGKTKAEEIRRVFREPYEDVDSEREIEHAIEKEPSLLFPGTVTLLARQHRLRLEDGTQGVIDMLFLDRQNEALYIVEIKKLPTTLMDYRQIKAYMQAAGNSDLMRRHLQAGASLRGILASIARSNFRPPTESVQVRTIDKRKVLEVLRKTQ